MAQPTVVLWDVDPILRSACEAAAREWGAVVAATRGDLSSAPWAPDVRLAVVGGCSGSALRERLVAARKQLPLALVVGLIPRAGHSALSGVLNVEQIAVAEEERSAFGLAADLLEAGSVSPFRWPAGIVGVSLASALLRARIALAADCDANVLLMGETGTGKSAAARAIHGLSARAHRPFVHVDCAALAPTVLESELFGHERGAFTGALARRPGRFEAAGDGTIFLDEIGEISDALQSKFLRVLEERLFEPVGSCTSQPMRARVVAATQVDLSRAVAEGRFRSDLYFRLRVYPIQIPSLRERRADIPALLGHALPRLCKQLGRAVPVVSASCWERLVEYSWPGNVRELFHTLEALLVRRSHGPLSISALEGVLAPTPRVPEPWAASMATDDDRLREAFEATGGNVALVARLLGVPRSTARYRIKRLGLSEVASRD